MRHTLKCSQHAHPSDSVCACKGQENGILLVRQNSSRLQRRNPIITPGRPCVLLVENRWVREPTGWKSLFVDGQRVQGWEGPRRNETLLSEYALSELKWCKWGVGRVQGGEIPFIRAHVHKRAQALATLTPAGQRGTPGRFFFFFFTKVQWYKSNHKSAYFIHQATKEQHFGHMWLFNNNQPVNNNTHSSSVQFPEVFSQQR